VKSTTYKKAGTNYAVTLEKLSKRDEAVKTLITLKSTFNNEVRVFNNLGIIQKRKGDTD
jgi:Flp pilus assembly protein TadD